MPNQNKILVRGARVNNLKNITVEIPKNKLVVITGLSGSGKSSLAFDTIFAEGQRRYVESLGASARQFLELQDKPDVDEIRGLSPTIAIEQKGLSENPRSTVATITEIADFLRLLFARAGRPQCLKCATELKRASAEEIVRQIQEEMASHPLKIFAPLVSAAKDSPSAQQLSLDDPADLFNRLERAGFSAVRLNQEIVPLEALKDTGLPANPYALEVPLGTFGPNELQEDSEHIRMQILTALELGDGKLLTEAPDGKTGFFSTEFTCPQCGNITAPYESRDFSFNSPHGACASCAGLGVKSIVIPELVLPNPRLSSAQGAVKPWTRVGANQTARLELLSAVAKRHNFSPDAPVGELSKSARNILLYGAGDEEFEVRDIKMKFQGVIPELEERYKDTDSDYLRKEIESYMRQETCPDCLGTRLNDRARQVTFAGKSIAQLNAMSIEEAIALFERITKLRNSEIPNDQKSKTRNFVNSQFSNLFTESDLAIAYPILKEILTRLCNIKSSGLDYLTLDRSSPALSGGEGQRLRLAIQLATTLSGIIYILDEPTVGLHERDTQMLLGLLKKLLAEENTVVVVEHDLRVMKEADWIIDMGPGAGEEGGKIVAEGAAAAISKKIKTMPGAYLTCR